MREAIGKTIHKIRINKGMKQKELSDNTISISQISNIEKGMQTPSAEKFIVLLGKLNVTYDEFTFLMDDGYLKAKTMMENNLREFVKRQNINGLKRLAREASAAFDEYDDIYFQHIESMALAMAHLIQSNNNYEGAREYLQPIKDYLDNIDEWGYYELRLISQCLFMFEIKTAISFGERALDLFERNYSLYKKESIVSALLANMATYALDYSDYYHFALKYAQMGINLAATNNDATRALRAKIFHQIACFKLENGLFNEKYLLSLVETFKLLEWHTYYEESKRFVEKHGILLSTVN